MAKEPKYIFDIVSSFTTINPYFSIGLSVLGVSQAVFWSFASLFPQPFYYFVDATFLAAFYSQIFGRALLGFLGAYLIITPIILLIWWYPIAIFRKLWARSFAKVLIRESLNLRLIFFSICLVLSFWGGKAQFFIVASIMVLASFLIIYLFVRKKRLLSDINHQNQMARRLDVLAQKMANMSKEEKERGADERFKREIKQLEEYYQNSGFKERLKNLPLSA